MDSIYVIILKENHHANKTILVEQFDLPNLEFGDFKIQENQTFHLYIFKNTIK